MPICPLQISLNKRRLWFILGLMCSVLVCWFMLWLSGSSLAELYQVVQHLSIEGVIGITLTSALVWCIRGMRLVILFPGLSLREGMFVSATHNALTRILPARTGELSLPALLNQRSEISLGEGGLTMVWLRLIEVASLGVMTVGSLAFAFAPILISPLTLGSITLLALMGAWWARPLISFGLKCVGRRSQWAQSLAERLHHEQRLSVLRTLLVIGLTVLILFAQAFLFALILWSTGAQISYFNTLLGSSVVHLSGVIPAPTMGNVGTHELGWVCIYTQLGVDPSSATLSAFLSQWLTLGLALIWWMFVVLIDRKKNLQNFKPIV